MILPRELSRRRPSRPWQIPGGNAAVRCAVCSAMAVPSQSCVCLNSTFGAPGTQYLSTRTSFKTHTGRCRVRRKRERLTSNGSIESDAALCTRLVLQNYSAASLPIEI